MSWVHTSKRSQGRALIGSAWVRCSLRGLGWLLWKSHSWTVGTKLLSEEKESQGRKNRQCLSHRHIISWEIKLKICSVPTVNSWQIDGETVETVTDFIFWGSKITADGDCSHEIKRHLLLGREVMTNLDSTLKSRDITLPTKVRSQGYGFSSGHVWM